MKALVAALFLIPALASAQAPQPQLRQPLRGGPGQPPSVAPGAQFGQGVAEAGGEVLPENLQLKLIITEKEQQIAEISCVVASTEFLTSIADPHIGFRGSITPEEDEQLLIRYNIDHFVIVPQGPNATQGTNSGAAARVRLRLGEPVQILKLGNRAYQLTVSRLAEAPKKGK